MSAVSNVSDLIKAFETFRKQVDSYTPPATTLKEDIEETKLNLETLAEEIEHLLSQNKSLVPKLVVPSSQIPKLIDRCKILLGEGSALTAATKSQNTFTTTTTTTSATNEPKADEKPPLSRRAHHLPRKSKQPVSKFDTNKTLHEKMAEKRTSPSPHNPLPSPATPKTPVTPPAPTPSVAPVSTGTLQPARTPPTPPSSSPVATVSTRTLQSARTPPTPPSASPVATVSTRVQEPVVTLSKQPKSDRDILVEIQQLLPSGNLNQIKTNIQQLSAQTLNTIKLWIWLFSSMPQGNPDFGGTILNNSPCDPAVKQAIKAYIENDGRLLSEKDAQALKAFADALRLAQNGKLALDQLSQNTTKLEFINKTLAEWIKFSLWNQNGNPMDRGADFSGDLIRQEPRHPSVQNVVKALRDQSPVALELLAAFSKQLANSDEAQVRILFSKLPHTLMDKVKLGIWLFKGMPQGDNDFGGNFMNKTPKDPIVQQVVQTYIAHNGHFFSEKDRNSLKGLRASFESKNDDQIRSAFYSLPGSLQELLKLSIWCKNGEPKDKGADFAGDLIRNRPQDPSFLSVVTTLVNLGAT